MAITRSMARKQNHDDDDDDASISKSIKTDDVGVGPWSNLNHDVLLLVMMQLGVIDFVAFSGVCKSWRSVALSNWKRFMASQPPLLMRVSRGKNDTECCLEDSEGRKFKTILPHFALRSCIGLTCGYLILVRLRTDDYVLVNPITRHELHFPPVPCTFVHRRVLVFSPSISRFIFVMLDIASECIWYCIAGEGAWKSVSSTQSFVDLHVFKGKIYTLNPGNLSWDLQHIYELTFNPEPKLTLLKTKNVLIKDLYLAELVNSGENLFLVKSLLEGGLYEVHKLDIGKMECEQFEDARDEHEQAFFLSNFKYGAYGAVVKPESWADPRSQQGRFNRHGRFFTANQWYFPRECFNVDSLIDES